mmetsp:Transcript_19448/g.38091  ORF Transcript_19448/g.38091 Transcript_19448/m.38091 type:complete len:84 (-) Transcript_19448:1396-1647(-)
MFPTITRRLLLSPPWSSGPDDALAQINAPKRPINAPSPSKSKTGTPNANFDPMIMSDAKFDKMNAFTSDVKSKATTKAVHMKE